MTFACLNTRLLLLLCPLLRSGAQIVPECTRHELAEAAWLASEGREAERPDARVQREESVATSG